LVFLRLAGTLGNRPPRLQAESADRAGWNSGSARAARLPKTRRQNYGSVSCTSMCRDGDVTAAAAGPEIAAFRPAKALQQAIEIVR
jgi:hypothetical protein